MVLITIITLLSIIFISYMLPHSSASFPSTTQFQPSFQHQANNAHSNHPRLVRKLIRATEKGHNEDRDFIASQYNKQKGYLSGKVQHRKKNMVAGKKETKEEKYDGEDPSQYFAKDYSHVGGRRPIHNKNLPIGP
ncbi:hypothetical protein HN51_000707 [Arachis hypogaea]|uniref:CLAVATA3/ESR (CLE)-related protein n=2 Tax=Arachis TaxID=3817 RepID=A0A445EUR2_ARAHY|nr:uncharacterized protein LOC112717814 [Arachis hypogaea]QHO48686.1 uncharacterized protein DS421_1g07530 [Arachis hypogaea]RYR79240.1 hypothetical protein Ahy_A01g004068 [Arachis hypogaea]